MNMKKFLGFLVILQMIFAFVSCRQSNKVNAQSEHVEDSVSTEDFADSTVYGEVIDGGQTVFMLLSDAGDTIEYILEDKEGEPVEIKGGYSVGDRLAVVASKVNNEYRVEKAINLLSLQGRWTSLDRNFTIEEGGIVHSAVEVERNPWTSWKIVNGRLLLNKQAFEVLNLTADSLALEDSTGIYLYKRQK